MPFLVLLVFWLTIIFLSFGLFAPPEWHRYRHSVPLRAGPPCNESS
jgi:hypothetical protein